MQLSSLRGMEPVPRPMVEDLPTVGRVLAHSASGRILGGAIVAGVAAAHPFVEWAVQDGYGAQPDDISSRSRPEDFAR